MITAGHANTSRARFDRFISRAFRAVVLQPTTYCPWACDYCYLPTKDLRLTMPVSVAEAVAKSVEEQGLPECVEVVWHGGEPLATGMEQFEALLDPFEALRLGGRVRHSLQTGAGLINPAWCELFLRYGFTVGVSIDGPEWADFQRRDRAGRSAHSRIMRGIRTLQDHGIPFTAIAVVTPSTIGRADEIAEFFEGLGCASVGFNIEEHEGANASRPDVEYERARQFWLTLLRRRAVGATLPVRDVDRLIWFISASRVQRSPWADHLYEPIPTVGQPSSLDLRQAPESVGRQKTRPPTRSSPARGSRMNKQPARTFQRSLAARSPAGFPHSRHGDHRGRTPKAPP
jgi:uncharacterized protein